ncbi:receptor-transporting protein 3-like isoform X2 [Heterodontus francisci]|uniref:receptor-transporting protein 3-like isoform X2 n=1 Tax=Heterodontus francisci TaxID=7792 RepID=UPI00355ACE11
MLLFRLQRDRRMTDHQKRFHCSSCSNKWASAKARILFNMRLQNGKGEVKVRFFKQQCRENHDEEVNFVKPVFSEENIEQVLDRLMTKIRQRCYNENIGKDHAAFRSDDNLQGPHETSHCEACSLGLCSEAV